MPKPDNAQRPAAAKKKAAPARPLTAGMVRAKIDRLDTTLVKLFQERARLTLEAAGLDQTPLTTVAELVREEESLRRLLSSTEGDLPDRCLRATFRELVSGCRAQLRALRVAFLGPLHSFSHLAALHRFGQSVEFVPVGSIAAVFEEVNRGQSSFGLVPIENSTDGRIADTLDMFARLPVRICGDVELRIHHTLLGKCARNEVTEVYSKPQAISQCRNWLAKHLPAARIIEVTSTSTAAQLAKEKPGAAAIASREAGIHYGLDQLAERIEDNPSNTTRFAVIGEHSAPRTGKDKMSLLFQVAHRPGALADTMGIFKRYRLNMTWIESFPIPDTSRTYFFFVELEGHETDARVKRALALLERRTQRLEILGSYPVTMVVE